MDSKSENKINKQKNFIIQFLYWGILLTSIIFVLIVTKPVLAPFVIAFIIAWILQKPIDKTVAKTHIPRVVISILFVVLFFALLALVFGICGTKVLAFLKEFSINIPDIFADVIVPKSQEIYNWIEKKSLASDPSILSILENVYTIMDHQMGAMINKISNMAISGISTVVTAVPSLLMKMLITVIATMFMTVDFKSIKSFLAKQIPDKFKSILEDARNYSGHTLFKCFISYIIIILLTFTELWIGLSLLKVPNAIIIAVVIAILDILPILGTGGVLIPWSICSALFGNITLSIGIIFLYLFITVVRNIVEPKLIGKQVGLHPIATLLSMLLGLHIFGFIGLFGFPITLSLLKNLNDRGIIHIFK